MSELKQDYQKSQTPLSTFDKIFTDYENEVSFLENSENFCVGTVDIINSTKVTAKLSYQQVCQYYAIFLNSMTKIVKENKGKIVKNIGDCILFYFPPHGKTKSNLLNCIECGKQMIEFSSFLNKKTYDLKLPPIHYRISMDYGPIALAKSSSLLSDDIFGSTVNICSKINHLANADGIVVGNDFYQMAKNFTEFNFKFVAGYPAGQKYQYPVYSLSCQSNA